MSPRPVVKDPASAHKGRVQCTQAAPLTPPEANTAAQATTPTPARAPAPERRTVVGHARQPTLDAMIGARKRAGERWSATFTVQATRDGAAHRVEADVTVDDSSPVLVTTAGTNLLWRSLPTSSFGGEGCRDIYQDEVGVPGGGLVHLLGVAAAGHKNGREAGGQLEAGLAQGRCLELTQVTKHGDIERFVLPLGLADDGHPSLSDADDVDLLAGAFLGAP